MDSPKPIAVAAAFALATALGLVASGGCGPPPPSDGGDCTLVVEWGRRLEGAFVPFADGDEAAVRCGFQGLNAIDSSARIGGVAATEVNFNFTITIEGREPYFTVWSADLAPGPDGLLYADAVPVAFNDVPLPNLVGRSAVVTVAARAAGCVGQTQSAVVLIEEVCSCPTDGGTACSGGF